MNGKEIDENLITYTGEKELDSAENLVIYSNIFQENKLFAREYEDISSELPYEKQETYQQQIKVQPLTQIEIDTINNPNFITEKNKLYKK